jgi:pilus assembly protein CpaF
MLGQLLELQYESRRQTQQRAFASRNIVEYKDGKYVVAEPISDANVREMTEQMGTDDALMFRNFLNHYWGVHDEY